MFLNIKNKNNKKQNIVNMLFAFQIQTNVSYFELNWGSFKNTTVELRILHRIVKNHGIY